MWRREGGNIKKRERVRETTLIRQAASRRRRRRHHRSVSSLFLTKVTFANGDHNNSP